MGFLDMFRKKKLTTNISFEPIPPKEHTTIESNAGVLEDPTMEELEVNVRVMKMKNAEEIISTRDYKRLMELDESETESVLIKLLYDFLYKKPMDAMNSNQRDLFLLMTLEDHCQADGLDSLSEDEDLFFRMPDTYKALLRINAPKSAAALKAFIDMLPEGCLSKRAVPDWKEWFMNDLNREKINESDGVISSYPDGLMRTLYTAFIKANADFVKDILDV